MLHSMNFPGLAPAVRSALWVVALSFSLPIALLAVEAPAAKPAAPKDDPIGHIDGFVISRPGGGFLGLRTVNNNFVLTFYDAKKHKVTPDVARAALRWPVHYQPAPERVVLNSGFDAASLTSPKIVRPPHQFKLFISLLVEGSDDAVESYTVDFSD